VVLQLRQAFTIKGNENRWNKIHTQDISELYMLLTEAVVDGRSDNLWNKKGYCFAQSGEFSWAEGISSIAALGYQKRLMACRKPPELSNELFN
jgi:hypothetical protein